MLLRMIVFPNPVFIAIVSKSRTLFHVLLLCLGTVGLRSSIGEHGEYTPLEPQTATFSRSKGVFGLMTIFWGENLLNKKTAFWGSRPLCHIVFVSHKMVAFLLFSP